MDAGNDTLESPTKVEGGSAAESRRTVATSPDDVDVQPSFAQALDRSEARRMGVFYLFGIAAPLVVLVVSVALEGDARAKHIFQVSIGLFATANLITTWLTRRKPAIDSLVMNVHFAFGGIALIPAVYYFGPFSAVTLVYPLALMFVALGRDQRTAQIVLGTALGGHLSVAFPIIVGFMTDVGLVNVWHMGRSRLALMEALILGMMASGHALGRWARHTSGVALAELANAKRIIADQKQVLGEVKDDAAKANWVKTGRWSGQAVGRWQLGLVLGRGAMGEVYDARDANGEEAAVKVLTASAEESPSLVQRFNRELQIASQLLSPHIVRVVDVSTATANVPYLAMEKLRGADLAARLRTEIRIPLKEVVSLLRQVASGLEVAHHAGVVHRDLKPHNLFLHDSTTWKILDFGVAKVFGVEGTLTQEAMIGTPQYMAPEQAMGEEVTPRSDIYALGAIAYRCLTGRVPHAATEFTGLIYQVVRGAPVRPGLLAQISRPVEDVLAVAMAKDPQQRFASATELVDQLAAAAEGRPLKLVPPRDAWALNAEPGTDALLP